ncbi:MAG TPA: hypothetical protein VI456_08405 [Polyangia bacterium]
MRLRGGNHRATAAGKAFTVAVMAAAIFAQLLSISHEMTVRHFRCAEHGELTHVVALAARAAELPAQRTNDTFRAGENQTADGHEHCGVAFTVEGTSCTPAAGATGVVAPAPALRPTAAAVVPRDRSGVLASAPKTSPPSA